MKIALLSPSPHYPKIFAYGVRLLSACLKRAGWEVTMIFLPRGVGERYSEAVLADLADLTVDAQLIGISLMTDDLENAVLMTSALRVHSKTPIIWGGIHPTIEPEACLEHADMVCIGEGEETLPELVRRLEAGEDHHHVPGTWCRVEGQVIRNPLRPLVADLDALPIPDYGKDDHFMLFEGRIMPVTDEMLRIAFTEYFITLTTRGCPFQCTYCWNHSYRRLFPVGPVIRKRSIDNVMAELNWIQDHFPYVEKMTIDDDAFFMRPVEEIRQFSEAYQATMRLPLWVTGATPTTLTREKLSLLSAAGELSIRMGIQTGSRRTQKLYRRTHDNTDVLKAARLLHEFRGKIKSINFDIILDNPWETDQDIRETLLFLSRLPVPYELFLFPLVFYPGTDLHDRAAKEGLLPLSADDEARIRHHRLRPTYINYLFRVLSANAQRGKRIPPPVMYLLTHPLLMSIGLSQKLCSLVESILEGTLRQKLSFRLR